MTTFECTCCDTRTEWSAGVEAPVSGKGKGTIRMCEACAACAFCDEEFRRSHPAHMREHSTPGGRDDSAAFVCVHCYALTMPTGADVLGARVVVQPDGSLEFFPLDGGAQ